MCLVWDQVSPRLLQVAVPKTFHPSNFMDGDIVMRMSDTVLE